MKSIRRYLQVTFFISTFFFIGGQALCHSHTGWEYEAYQFNAPGCDVAINWLSVSSHDKSPISVNYCKARIEA